MYGRVSISSQRIFIFAGIVGTHAFKCLYLSETPVSNLLISIMSNFECTY